MSRFRTLCGLTAVMALAPMAVPTPTAAQETQSQRERLEERREARRQQQRDRGASAAGGEAQTAAESKPADGAAAAAAPTQEQIDKEMADLRAKRDAELEAAQTEADKARLERKKQEIFSKYAAIAAAMRDRYQAAQAAQAEASPAGTEPDAPDADAAPRRRPSRVRPGREKLAGEKPAADTRPKPAAEDAGQKQLEEARKKLASVEQKLAAETARHEAKVADLQAKLQAATDGGSGEADRQGPQGRRKENATYQAKKADLEAQRDAEAAGRTARRELTRVPPGGDIAIRSAHVPVQRHGLHRGRPTRPPRFFRWMRHRPAIGSLSRAHSHTASERAHSVCLG